MASKELFDDIAKLVADPHTTIVEHDQVRSAKILITTYLYLSKKFTVDEDHSALIFKEDLEVLVDCIPFEIMEKIKDEVHC